ncbi:Lrp/AsnC family transcriptional regulator [Marinimicrobium sp. LS-A18]|uniref:Lrp/AsnC family transcriptional regulator n=1 Tax=Marinimicrobium sp. LS-A18 TaxID=1381596 RepID=UPI0004B17D98|nr:Lrp/AsnC family transcriptional regulator [Marinimicrobium sp. LS-A18]
MSVSTASDSIDLDDYDRKILRALQGSADYSMADLGNLIGLSHTPCWRRLKRLEAEGIIRGKVTLLDPKKVGMHVVVHSAVRLTGHQSEALAEFEAGIQAVPEVLECYASTGDSDYLLKVVVNSIEHYEQLLNEKLRPLPHVASIRSNFALKQVKYTTELPL